MKKTIVIIGKGLSGIKAAHQLCKDYQSNIYKYSLSIVFVDKNRFGGNTYNRQDVNVGMANPISLLGFNHPHDALNWAKSKVKPIAIEPLKHITHNLYGEYLRSVMDELKLNNHQNNVNISIEEINQTAIDLDCSNSDFKIMLDNNEKLNANAVILATGNVEPHAIAHLQQAKNYYNSDDIATNKEHASETDAMVILGMGNGAHYTALNAFNNGFKGTITLASVDGYRPRYNPKNYEFNEKYVPFYMTKDFFHHLNKIPYSEINQVIKSTFLKELRYAKSLGYSAYHIIDYISHHLTSIWIDLNPSTRKHIDRKMLVNFNNMRHRVPQEHAQQLNELKAKGQLKYRSGLKQIQTLHDHQFLLTFEHGNPLISPKIINNTGPSAHVEDMGVLFRNMLLKEYIQQHEHGGIQITSDMQVLSSKGPLSGVYAIGPVARGCSMAFTIKEIMQSMNNFFPSNTILKQLGLQEVYLIHKSGLVHHFGHVIPNKVRDLLNTYRDPSSQAPQDDDVGRNDEQDHKSCRFNFNDRNKGYKKIEGLLRYSKASWANQVNMSYRADSNHTNIHSAVYDIESIKNSTLFKRLEHIYQFDISHANPHCQNRMSHSLFVADVAETICDKLDIDQEGKSIASAIALAHDIGHPPFGHRGERGIKQFIKKYNLPLHFDHDAHGVELIMTYTDKESQFPGLNLSAAVLEGVLKRYWRYSDTEEHTFFNHPESEIPACVKELDKRMCSHGLQGFCFDKHAHIYSQITAISDWLSFTATDTVDGLRIGLFSLDEIKEHFSLIATILLQDAALEQKIRLGDEEALSYFQTQIKIMLINDVVWQTQCNIQQFCQTENNQHPFAQLLVSFTPNTLQIMQDYARFFNQTIFHRLEKRFLLPKMQENNKRFEDICADYLEDLYLQRIVLLNSEGKAISPSSFHNDIEWAKHCIDAFSLQTDKEITDYWLNKNQTNSLKLG